MTAHTLLRGARLVGGPAEIQDVLVADGAVAAIAPSIGASGLGAGLEIVDLDGRFVGPGMWDHHVHFTQWALHRTRIDLSPARSAAHAVTIVDEWMAANPAARGGVLSGVLPGAVLTGGGFRAAMWPDQPSVEALDRVTGDRPVVLISADIHGAWLNSAALARFGCEPDETGLLREKAAFAVNVALRRGDDPMLDGRIRGAASAAAAKGVVGIVDLEMGSTLDTWAARIAGGVRSLRVRAGVYLEHLENAIERGLRTGDVLPGSHGLLEQGPFKILTDGSLNTRTAYCHDPYPNDGVGGGVGMSTVGFEELVSSLRRAAASGIRPAVHAIGDRANRFALDAFEAAGCTGSIEHAQLVSREDFGRFAALGVTASVQPEHAMDDRDVADLLWAGRTDRAFAFESLLAAGATLRLGSDAPVAPLDPWISMAAAVSRSRDGREPWHPEQRIAQRAAYAASVSSSAVSDGAFLRVGDNADLAITELDPLRAGDDDLRSMVVAGTMLAGDWTHRGL